MKTGNRLLTGILLMGLSIALLLAVNAQAYEERIGTVSGTTAQTIIVGSRDTVCIYCTTGSIRYTVGNSSNLVAATASSAAVDFPGDCYKVPMGRGNDRLSIIHKDGASSFACEINAVIKP
jgi:hypothetical protein